VTTTGFARTKAPRQATWRRLATALCGAAIVVAVLAESNVCCPGCPGCDDNWECAGAVLSAISQCCGVGDGTAKCVEGSFNVICATGASCNGVIATAD
jgi:hypothetical protein